MSKTISSKIPSLLKKKSLWPNFDRCTSGEGSPTVASGVGLAAGVLGNPPLKFFFLVLFVKYGLTVFRDNFIYFLTYIVLLNKKIKRLN